MTKVFCVINHHTNEFQVYNGRCAWTKRGNAVNAFNQNRPVLDRKQFEDYEKAGAYSVVEISEYYFMYKDLCE